jgi:hypothetical protein
MKRVLLLALALGVFFSVAFVSSEAKATARPMVVEDGGGGYVTPCNASTYGTYTVFYNFVYGTRVHVCRYAGGFVYWGSAIQSYVYAGGNPVSGNWGYAEWTCNISPNCYVYAYVPA